MVEASNTKNLLPGSSPTASKADSSAGIAQNYGNNLAKSNIRSIQSHTFECPGNATTLGRVGIIANGFESTYYGQMVETASKYLMARGFQALVQSNLHSRMGELDAWSSLTDC